MPKISKIKASERKDSRGGGYAKRKFTTAEANNIRGEYEGGKEEGEGGTRGGGITISALARKYEVSQPLMYQLIKGTTYND